MKLINGGRGGLSLPDRRKEALDRAEEVYHAERKAGRSEYLSMLAAAFVHDSELPVPEIDHGKIGVWIDEVCRCGPCTVEPCDICAEEEEDG